MLLYVMCLWIWPKTSISNVAKTFMWLLNYCVCCSLMHGASISNINICWLSGCQILLCHCYCVAVKFLIILRGVTSPMDCKGDNIQVSFQSMHPNKWRVGSNPMQSSNQTRNWDEPNPATKQGKGWSHPQNEGWNQPNPHNPKPNTRLDSGLGDRCCPPASQLNWLIPNALFLFF